MTKEKLISLNKYAQDLKNKLTSPTPVKHKNRPESYKKFLTRELEMVNSKIDAAKLEAATTNEGK